MIDEVAPRGGQGQRFELTRSQATAGAGQEAARDLHLRRDRGYTTRRGTIATESPARSARTERKGGEEPDRGQAVRPSTGGPTGAQRDRAEHRSQGPSPNAKAPAGTSRRGRRISHPAITHVSPTVLTRLDHKALNCENAPALDHVNARRRFRLPVPCRTAVLARQHHSPRTKIRTRCGPTRSCGRRFHLLSQVRGDGGRVPPADEEPAGGTASNASPGWARTASTIPRSALNCRSTATKELLSRC